MNYVHQMGDRLHEAVFCVCTTRYKDQYIFMIGANLD